MLVFDFLGLILRYLRTDYAIRLLLTNYKTLYMLGDGGRDGYPVWCFCFVYNDYFAVE